MPGLKLINRGRYDTPVLEEFEHLTQNLGTFLAQIFDANGNLLDQEGNGGSPAAHATTHVPGGADVLQLTAGSRLFGRGSSSAGAVQEITLGTNLAMTGTTLDAVSAGASTVLSYRYATTTVPPPTNSQLELDAVHPFTAATHLYVHPSTADGLDAYWPLLLVAVGQVLNIQDKADHTKYVSLTVTAAPIDQGTHIDIPVAWRANGTAIANQAVVLLRIAAAGGVAAHHTTHEDGGSDEVTLAQSQVTGLTTVLNTHAADINAIESALAGLGHWQAVPYSAGNFVSSGATWTVEAGDVIVNRYSLVGKTLIWTLHLTTTSLSAPGPLYLFLPAGLYMGNSGLVQGMGMVGDSVGWNFVRVAQGGSTSVQLLKLDFSNFPATTNALSVAFSLTCEVL